MGMRKRDVGGLPSCNVEATIVKFIYDTPGGPFFKITQLSTKSPIPNNVILTREMLEELLAMEHKP
jgi:hypothetical protein